MDASRFYGHGRGGGGLHATAIPEKGALLHNLLLPPISLGYAAPAQLMGAMDR